MKNLIIFVSILSITLGFPVGSPLHKKERRRRQLGFGYDYGYGSVYPFYNPLIQPDLQFNDFTPEIHIKDPVKPPVPKPVTPRPRQRPTTSMVQPVPFNGFQPTGDPCPPTREDFNNAQLPVFFSVDPNEWSAMGVDQPLSPGQSGSNDLQPAFAIIPGYFLPAAGDERGTQSAVQNPMRNPNWLRAFAVTKKEKDC